jgi:hypothetical protein
MKGSMRAATAIGIGYLLGRRKKFRTATMLAAATAVGGTTVGGIALKRGMKMLGSSDALQKVAPQLGELTDVVRGDLLSAGKAAATSAVSNRMDALTDSLHDRAARVRDPEAAVAEGADKATKTGKKAGQKAAGAGKRAVRREDPRDEDIRDDDISDEDYEDYEDYDYQDDDDYEADDRTGDRAGDADDEARAKPVRRARPSRSSGGGTATRRKSPVTRTRG